MGSLAASLKPEKRLSPFYHSCLRQVLTWILSRTQQPVMRKIAAGRTNSPFPAMTDKSIVRAETCDQPKEPITGGSGLLPPCNVQPRP